MNGRNALATMLFGISAMSLPAGALAQSADEWKFEAALNGYLPTIGGTTVFAGTGASGPNINMDAQTIIDHLKMVFMGSFEARRGVWGAYTDVLYMDIGGSKSATRLVTDTGIGFTANADLDVKATVWSLAGMYRAMSVPEGTLDVLGGARLLDVKPTLGWSIIGTGPLGLGQTGTSSPSLTIWDAIVGVKGKVLFGDQKQWFAPYYADIGTGGSDLTYQLSAGIGYAFKWGDVIGAWRYLDYNMKSGKAIQSMNLNGPVISLAFRW